MTPPWRGAARLSAVAAALAGTSARPEPKDEAMRAAEAVYDLAAPRNVLACGRHPAGEANLRRAEWRMRDKRVVLDIPFVRPLAPVPQRPDLHRWNLAFRIPVRNPAALSARRTRVTLSWSAMKTDWSEQEIRLAVNGTSGLGFARAASASTAGRRLSIVVPAVDVRRCRGLNIVIDLAERAGPTLRTRGIHADALELELLP